jgi:hypothetical protein
MTGLVPLLEFNQMKALELFFVSDRMSHITILP